jgi:hypothetical protein
MCHVLLLILLSALGLSITPRPLMAQSQSLVSAQVLLGVSTYKSAMLQGNDTSFSGRYSFGLSIGGDKGFMMGLDNESTSVRFLLNNSRLTLEEQDVFLVYRWAVIYAGLAFTRGQWHAKAAPDLDANGYIDFDTPAEDYLNASNSGNGLNFGLLIPIAKVAQLQSDFRYLISSKVQQTIPENLPLAGQAGTEPILGRTLTMGPKVAIALDASVDVVGKALSLTAGYHYRSYEIILASHKFRELYLTTYIGLASAWNF